MCDGIGLWVSAVLWHVFNPLVSMAGGQPKSNNRMMDAELTIIKGTVKTQKDNVKKRDICISNFMESLYMFDKQRFF